MEGANAPAFTHYVDSVRGRLAGAGFDLLDGSGQAALTAHRRQAKFTRFGFVDTVVAISQAPSHASADHLVALTEQSFRDARQHKIWLPRGLGSQLVSYPALVLEQATPELRSFVAQYAPKHWSALDFPSVVELSTGSVLCYEKTPVWGGAYYRKTRQEVSALLSPR
jgi:hypothetical protein